MSSLPPEDDQLKSIREAIVQLFARLRDLEARLAGIESSEGATGEPDVAPEPREFAPPSEPVVDEEIDIEIVEDGAPPEPVPEPPAEPAFVPPVETGPRFGEPEVEDPTAWESPATGRGASTRPSRWSVLTKLSREKDENATWEAVVGGRWMTWAGALTLIVAVAFSIQWVWQNFDTPDWVKVAAFHALGLGLLVAGHALYRRELKVFAHGLSGLGIFTLYAIAFSTLHHYELWSERVAFVECSAITLVAIATAIRKQSVAIVLLGALGGYLTPLLTSTGSGAYVSWFLYLAFLNVALIGCAVLQSWNFLKPIAWAATAAMFTMWLRSPVFTDFFGEKLWPTEWLVVLHGLIFLAGTTIPPVLWQRASTRADLSALTAGSMWFVGTTYYLFHALPDQQLALVSWGMALLHLVLFAVTYSRVTNVDRMPRVHLAMAAVFFTLAAPLQLNDASYLAAAWCVEGLVFAAVGVYFRDRQMNVSAIIVFVLAAFQLGWEYFSDPRVIEGTDIDLRFFIFACCGTTAMAAGGIYLFLPRLLEQDAAPHDRDVLGAGMPMFETLSGAALLALGNMVVLLGMTCQWDNRVVLALWALDAAVVWMIGFAWKEPAARWYACLVGIGFAGGRALYHNVQLPEPYELVVNARFGALALVSAVYFAFGWMYYRLADSGVGEPSRSRTRGNEEGEVHAILGVLANVAMLVAICLEVHKWFTDAMEAGWTSASREVAEMVSYSVVSALYALVLLAAGVTLRYPLYRALALGGLGAILAKLMIFDFGLDAHKTAGGLDYRFIAAMISTAVVAGAWGLGRLLPNGTEDDVSETDRNWLAGEWRASLVLLAAANVVAMFGLTRQWDTRLVLVLWTIDVAAVWTAGFVWRSAAIRWYAAAVALGLVGGRAAIEFNSLDGTFRLLANGRFLSLALVAATYFAAGWYYRKLRLAAASKTKSPSELEKGDWNEARLDPLFGILGNVVLLFAITWEIASWYAQARVDGRAPFPDMRMAEQATYSIVWAIYAAVAVGVGFALRYRLFRLLGLIGFAPILGKVFLIDLANLEVFPRILAFAVLGLTLMGVSALYQKFAPRIEQRGDGS